MRFLGLFVWFFFFTPSTPISLTLVCSLGALPHRLPLQMAKAPILWSWGRVKGYGTA